MWRYVLLLIALAFLFWTATTSLTQVQPNERAVVRRFGRILELKPEQGLFIGMPWGIDRVDLVPIGVRSIDVGFTSKEDADDEVIPAGQMLTGDHNLVNVQATIKFRVRPRPVELEKFVLQKDQIDAFVSRAAESLLAEWVAGHRINYVLKKGKIDLASYLQSELPIRLKEYELGIEIDGASIDLHPPAQVKDAFDRLAQAETGIQTKINQADQTANRLRDEARSDAFRIDQLAQAYAREEKIKANADAASFTNRLVQYRAFSAKNPDYLNALWLDEVTRLFGRMREGGRIDLLDHYLTPTGLDIMQFPLPPRKK